MRGKVKWFNATKRYGLIVCDDGSKDAFVHATDVLNEAVLREGDAVEFVLGRDAQDRPKATQVRKVA